MLMEKANRPMVAEIDNRDTRIGDWRKVEDWECYHFDGASKRNADNVRKSLEILSMAFFHLS